MRIELDHLFVCTAPGAPEAEKLVEAGLREGVPNEHSGQSTTSRYADQWTVSNWNCRLSGITTQSTPASVSPGDEIVSSITENCRPGTLSCASWTIFSLDTHNGNSTTLLNTPSEGQVFNWAFGGALEPYFVVSCDDFPKDRHETYQVVVFDERFLPIDPKWSVSWSTTDTPRCGYQVDAKPFKVSLDF
jgi:hypothetical protein